MCGLRSVLLEELCRTCCCCSPFLGLALIWKFFSGRRVVTWPMVSSTNCWRSSSNVFLDRHQLQPRCAVYPQQHIRTPHLAPVVGAGEENPGRVAGAGAGAGAATDDVGKQSPGERAFRHPSVRASRSQHGDGQLCKPGQNDAAKAGHLQMQVVVDAAVHDAHDDVRERRPRMRHAALRLRVQREKRSPFPVGRVGAAKGGA